MLIFSRQDILPARDAVLPCPYEMLYVCLEKIPLYMFLQAAPWYLEQHFLMGHGKCRFSIQLLRIQEHASQECRLLLKRRGKKSMLLVLPGMAGLMTSVYKACRVQQSVMMMFFIFALIMKLT